ncbi:cation/acetate symporter [Nocardia farcinica]|uniref:Acetate transporter ActP n=1 Tax=Nocardia farcinica TaxID=37329 RepID=A0A0H5NPU8_NOCFR|nr:Acetate transporter ActP [Nocardia farcinica]SIT34404.1 cation/acetate symporter [Nocardia farcinica]
MTTSLLAAGTVGNPAANIAIFALFVVVTMVVVIRASRNNATASDYFTGGRGFSGPQNGIAIAGDYLSAASFLGIAGAIAVYGYDGFLYSIGFLVAWLVALLLVAEMLRNTGKFTMADVLSFRLRERPVRTAAALSTLTVSLFYLLAQMAGAGGLVALLLDIDSRAGQSLVIAVVGVLMIVYVLVGGMKGTTWVQIIKAVLLIAGAAFMTVLVLAKFGFNLSEILGSAQQMVSGSANDAVASRDVLAPGAQYGANETSKLNFLSLGLALVLGTAGLPHVLMRFYTVPTAKEARRSVVWAIALIGAFYLFTLVLGYGAAAIVGPDRILAAAGGQNSAAPLLAFELGGVLLLGIISAVAFATILAVVAGLTITASASFAHDIYASVIKRGKVEENAQVRVSRITAVVIGLLAIGLGILANGQNIAFLVALAFAVAAAANLPTIVYSPVLAAVQHHRRAVEHVRRSDLDHRADRVLPGRVRQQVGHAPGHGLRLVPAVQPRNRLHPLGFRPRHRRHPGRWRQARGPGQGRGDGSSLAHRCGRGEGRRALTVHPPELSRARHPAGPGTTP